MWKCKTFVLILLLISTVQGDVIENILVRLERVYDYILTHHNLMNIDSIFGVILSQAFLSEVKKNAIDDLQQLRGLISKGGIIISKTIARLEEESMFHKFLVEIAFDPIDWQRGNDFESGLLDPNYMKGEANIRIQDYILAENRKSYNESFSDDCIMEVLEGPYPSANNACPISPLCQKVMVDNPDFGSGYSTTHRLLYLQLSRISGCKFDESKISKYCSKILSEIRLIHRFGLTIPLQDLLFEQVTLCGLEGFEEFMQDYILEAVMSLQQDDGCYGIVADGLRAKREANIIGENCVDHTTGLGASTLSLFLKYYSQKLI